MQRKEWKFDYTASKLAEAAEIKCQFHKERLEWWRDKKDQVITQIRAEGLEIDEKIVLEYVSPKSRDWGRGSQVTVRDHLRKNLDECLKKLAYHTELIGGYHGWNQVRTFA